MPQSRLLVEKKRAALHEALLALGAQVELALRQSLEALSGQDLELARAIVAGDAAINRQRRLLEQEALLVLAAYQPAGLDLRIVGASMELVAELERIGDYAADVARLLLRHEQPRFPAALVAPIAEMGAAAVAMFCDAMAAYGCAGGDAAMARAVATRDDAVDALEGELVAAIVAAIREDPAQAAPGLALSRVAHLYERVADRATNIAERVVYIATGETPDLD
ncbi:phosphate signaling complex protein PhoU [uncultured Thiodictyon sp.]|uniref:phosphate signaling complex protein PhoU n=1 Tax=uncultured Thiodictyon sp. TaxID=1846217 RepID=UPI0025D359E5|nr:phosphate signaling complex protein PhoU [uncultured Thiodictyon sp.]